jgi:hypothetical protein
MTRASRLHPKKRLPDYTEAEWSRIRSAIAKVRRDPLTDTECDALRITADDYLASLSQKKNTCVPSRAAERKAWEAVSQLIVKLQRALDAATQAHCRRNLGDARLLFVTEEILAAVLGRPQPPQKTVPIIYKGLWTERTIQFHPTGSHRMTSGEVNVLLSQIKFQIDSLITNCHSGPAYCFSYTGRLEPRVPYMQQILWLWTHRFGGNLTLSVDSTCIPARVYGSLVDYIAAVAGPILKAAAPKPSGLRDVVERQKKFYVWLSNYERKNKTQIEPWAYNRAVTIRERDRYGDVESRS